jgi:two-component system, NarL family, nitrate/nitrite response regulator NarL
VLTVRELSVLSLIAAGHTNREIAEQLFISVRTVEFHRENIRRKLGASSRAELTRHARKNGL